MTVSCAWAPTVEAEPGSAERTCATERAALSENSSERA
jgi:hypothetical protein